MNKEYVKLLDYISKQHINQDEGVNMFVWGTYYGWRILKDLSAEWGGTFSFSC